MLSGVRVLDCSDESGWLAGRILADLGADVVKVEPPGGDRAARRGPYLGGREDPERSLPWLAFQAGKRGITLDGARPVAQRALARLLDWADVLLETFTPAERARWRLEPERVAREHPRLVHCSLTPFGCTGPWARWRAGDLVAVALGGSAALTGDPDRPPVRCTLPTSWLHAGPEAALAVLMALQARVRTGRGRHVDVAIHESQLQTLLGAPGLAAHDGRRLRRSARRAPPELCNDAPALVAHPQLRARGAFTTLALAEPGAALELPGAFARSSRHRIGPRRRAPRTGEHQEEVFAAAGVPPAELEKLAAEGAV